MYLNSISQVRVAYANLKGNKNKTAILGTGIWDVTATVAFGSHACMVEYLLKKIQTPIAKPMKLCLYTDW